MDREARHATIHGVAKSRTWLSDWTELTELTLLTMVHPLKAMVYPVVMYGCESWTIKKAEHWRIEVFELWCWRRLLSPLDCKETKPVNPKDQSWIFNGRTDAEAETPIVWPPNEMSWLIRKDPNAGKDWNAGGEGDDRGWDGWMTSLTQWMWVWASSGSCWWTGKLDVLQFMGS